MSHLKKLSDRLSQKFTPTLLPLVRFGHTDTSVFDLPITRLLTLSRKLREFLLPSLKLTAAHYRLSSLTAPQVGKPLALMVAHRDIKDGMWDGYEAQASDYTTFLNPEIAEPTDFTMVDDFEVCPSLPNVKAEVSRFQKVTLQYTAESGEKKEEELTGFKARVFQHEIDHFYGLSLLNFSVNDGNLQLISPRDHSKLLEVDREYQLRFSSALKIAEERYLTDASFKAKIDRKVNGKGIQDANESLQDYALDSEFESKMTRALEDALREDQMRELEESSARPKKTLRHK